MKGGAGQGAVCGFLDAFRRGEIGLADLEMDDAAALPLELLRALEHFHHQKRRHVNRSLHMRFRPRPPLTWRRASARTSV